MTESAINETDNVFLFSMLQSENVSLLDPSDESYNLEFSEYMAHEEISEEAKLYAIRETVFEFVEAQDVRAIDKESANYFLILLGEDGVDQAISLSDLNELVLGELSDLGDEIEKGLKTLIPSGEEEAGAWLNSDKGLLVSIVTPENTHHWDSNFFKVSQYLDGSFSACGPTEDHQLVYAWYDRGELYSGDFEMEMEEELETVARILTIEDTDSISSSERAAKILTPEFYMS